MNGFEKRSAQKKHAILKAASEIMNGPEGSKALTIDKVTAATNISKATIFKYFQSKDNLIKMVFKNFMAEMAYDAEKTLQEKRSFPDTFTALTQLKINRLDHVSQQFYLDLMAYYSQTEDKELAEFMNGYAKKSNETLLTLFQQGRKEGFIDPKYTDEFLFIYTESMIAGIAEPAIYTRALPYIAEWSEVLLKGLAPEK
ncbi:TetR/AcrR family transcriptional regulator [Enterococcus sp. S86.2]|uniref:TetR/AcrR family transcriptional regulator n=1 Tax=Enterococcus sp. S86.2 TaxID=3031299 RepID=UPI0026E9E695|nr:TetR/AcrR family transcriptional regulator [Enterococcus sp. S86.2]